MRHQNSFRLILSFIIISALLSPVTTNAAEFAYLLSTKVIKTKDEGNGRSISFSYGGFGLLTGLELKTFQHKTYGSINLGLLLGNAIIEVGMNEHGPTFRGAMAIPSIPHMDILGSSRLDVTLGYEANLGDNQFNGPFAGINIFFFD